MMYTFRGLFLRGAWDMMIPASDNRSRLDSALGFSVKEFNF